MAQGRDLVAGAGILPCSEEVEVPKKGILML